MSESITPDAPENAPANPPANSPQNPPPTPPSAPQSAPQSDAGISDLRAEIAALPERLTNSIREALTPPKAPEPQKSAEPEPKSEPEPKTKTPGKPTYKSFGHRWFGISE